MSMQELFGEEIISSYSRAQAIEDGMLIDVSDEAANGGCGFTFPVALTTAAWVEAVKVPKSNKTQTEAGRLHDVLWMLRCAIKRASDPRQVDYRLKVGRKLVSLKALCGPGDTAEPVITIMLPHED